MLGQVMVDGFIERVIRVLCLLSLAVLIAPGFARAQGTGDASIVGEVSDSSGAVLPGATVVASSPVLLGQDRTTVTDDQGRYTLLALRPGTYTLKITSAGFQTLNRTGLELTSNFTATINVSLTVGAVQQEVTVTAAAPMVDTQSVTQQQTITRELLTTVPTSQSALGIASLMPAVVEPPNAQDVGGTKGETSVRISIHGGKSYDARLRQEGMIYSALTPGNANTFGQSGLEGTGRGYYVDPIATSEIVVDTGSMGSAEYGVGGAQSNAIYKDGGDQFHGAVAGAWTDHMLQWGNLDQNLINHGFTHANGTRFVYDGDAEIGGPIKKGKAWWLVHARGWGDGLRTPLFLDANEGSRIAGTLGVAGLPAGITAANWKYAASTTPVNEIERDKAAGARVAFAPTSKDKLTFSYDHQINFQDSLSLSLLSGTTKLEGNGAYCQNESVTQVTWTRVQNSKLLFQGGVTRVNFNFGSWATNTALTDFSQCGKAPYNNVAIADSTLGYTYNGAGSKTVSLSHQTNGRFLTDVVKGSHDFKFGTQWMWGLGGGYRTATNRSPSQISGLPVSYSFANGVPTSLTEFVAPLYTTIQLNPDLGIFGQDQWRITRKLTFSYGLRFDWVRENVPSINEPASLLTGLPARTLPALYNVPNWKDLNPRFGIVWDPTGSGKTAIKAGINRYIDGDTTGIGNDLAPATSQVSSTTRTWTDGNHNFLPDCNLANNALQDNTATGGDKCGPVANSQFGSASANTIKADPNWVQGWGKRPYGWQLATTVQQQITPSLSVAAGYYRSWYGNQVAVNNTAVNPSNFDSYCLPIPSDPQLPASISGGSICGLADLHPGLLGANGLPLFGQVANYVTFARNFGRQTDIYNGADVLFQFNRRGLLIAGGLNIGNTLQTGTTAGGVVQASTNQCFTVWTPQQSFFVTAVAGSTATLIKCAANPPYQSRFRVNGSYNLPHGIVFAAVFQSNPGPVYMTNISYSAAVIQTALGRPSASGATQTVEVDNPYSQFGPRVNQLDIRGTKNVAVWGERKLQLNFDLYNLMNSNAVEAIFSTYGSTTVKNASYGNPTQIMDARLFKFSFQFNF